MSGYERKNRNVLRWCLKTASDGAAVTRAGRSFHTTAPEAVNVRLPTVDRRMISMCKRSEPDECSRLRDGMSAVLIFTDICRISKCRLSSVWEPQFSNLHRSICSNFLYQKLFLYTNQLLSSSTDLLAT